MTSQDGGPWGLGRWSNSSGSSTVEYDSATYPPPYYAPPSAPPYAASAPSAHPAYPEYSSYASYPSTTPDSSLYPKIRSPASVGYPAAPSQGQYPPIASGYTSWPSRTDSPYPVVPAQSSQENSSYSPYVSGYAPFAPQAPQGGYAQGYGGGAPYNQLADPTAGYNLPPSPTYPSSPGYPQAGGVSYESPGGLYPPPIVPPSLEGLSLGGDERDDGQLRANSMPGNCFCTMFRSNWHFRQALSLFMQSYITILRLKSTSFNNNLLQD